jgi:hypothetical protein
VVPESPSPLVSEHGESLRRAAALGPIVELACGRGRIACAVAGLGLPVVGIDRDAALLREFADRARGAALPVAPVRCDLETRHGLPLRPRSCGAVLVFRYLHRPLAPAIAEALATGGLLLYETFTIHQRDLPYGPSRPEFLLREGELPALFTGLEILSSWEGWSGGERPCALARLTARRPA